MKTIFTYNTAPEIMIEPVDETVIHAPVKQIGHRAWQTDIIVVLHSIH